MMHSPTHTPIHLEHKKRQRHFARFKEMLGPAAFTRLSDETDEEVFGRVPGPGGLAPPERAMTNHLLAGLVVEPEPAVLELFPGGGAGGGSLLPPGITTRRHVLFPPNVRAAGPAVTTEGIEYPCGTGGPLPHEAGTFDVVLSPLTVPYLVEAERVLSEAARVLAPGGLLAVIWTDDFDRNRSLRYWAAAEPAERVLLVEEYLGQSEHLERAHSFTYPVLPGSGASSEVYLVYAERRLGAAGRRAGAPRAAPTVRFTPRFGPDELAARLDAVARTRECPFCGDALIEVPVAPSPWGGWDTATVFICLNDTCPKLLESYGVLAAQGIRGYSYRAMFHPGTGQIISLPSPLTGDQMLPRRLSKDH